MVLATNQLQFSHKANKLLAVKEVSTRVFSNVGKKANYRIAYDKCSIWCNVLDYHSCLSIQGAVVAFCRPCDLPSKGINSSHLVNAKDQDQFKVGWEDESKRLQCPDHQQG